MSVKEDLMKDILKALDDTGLVDKENMVFFELQAKENAEDSLFPRIELSGLMEDNDEYVGQVSVKPTCVFGLGYYERWTDLVDTRDKSIDRQYTMLEISYTIRKAIFDLNMKKRDGLLTCTGFLRVHPKYTSNIIHEFIENHSTLIMTFGVEITETW